MRDLNDKDRELLKARGVLRNDMLVKAPADTLRKCAKAHENGVELSVWSVTYASKRFCFVISTNPEYPTIKLVALWAQVAVGVKGLASIALDETLPFEEAMIIRS